MRVQQAPSCPLEKPPRKSLKLGTTTGSNHLTPEEVPSACMCLGEIITSILADFVRSQIYEMILKLKKKPIIDIYVFHKPDIDRSVLKTPSSLNH